MNGAPPTNGATASAGDRPAGELPLDRLRYVAVEGCIGVGKTTLTHLLSRHLSGHTVLEVVEENPFLPEFYRDQVAHAFKTQMFFLLSRFKQQEALVQADLFSRTLVSDYLFDKDRIFAELTLSPSELSLYEQIFRALASKVRSPDLVVYLHAPMEVILARIEQRGRPFEKDIDRDYLEALVDAYGRFFRTFDAAPVLTIDTADLNFPENERDLGVVLQTLSTFPTDDERRRLVTGTRDQRQPSLV